MALLTDVLTLLSEANPVRLEDAPQMNPALPDAILARRRPSRRLVLAGAVAAAALVASLIGVFAFGGASSPPAVSTSSSPGLGMESTLPGATVEHPLVGAKVVALADAGATFGPGLVLPDTSLVGSADLGPVWLYTNRDESNVAVALTFPKQGIFIQYLRPRPEGNADLVTVYRDIARENSNFHLLDLNGVPALAADQNSDDTGHNFGVVAFPINGDEIRVFGHYDQATLRQVAQSILDREGGASQVIGPADAMATLERPLGGSTAKPITLAAAPSILGGPVVLPDSSSVHPSDAGAVWGASVHESDGESSSAIGVAFPSQGLIVQYMRPPIPDPLANYQGFARDNPGSSVIDLNGTPARAIAQTSDPSSWGSMEFVAGGTTILVMGQTDQATLQPVAQSILDRSRG